MLNINKELQNIIHPTFSELMVNPLGEIRLQFRNEMDNSLIRSCLLSGVDNESPHIVRFDTYSIMVLPEDEVNPDTNEISFSKNGFWEYEAFELLPDDMVRSIEIGRCNVTLPQVSIPGVYK